MIDLRLATLVTETKIVSPAVIEVVQAVSVEDVAVVAAVMVGGAAATIVFVTVGG